MTTGSCFLSFDPLRNSLDGFFASKAATRPSPFEDFNGLSNPPKGSLRKKARPRTSFTRLNNFGSLSALSRKKIKKSALSHPRPTT
jgi:hypothetical protein